MRRETDVLFLFHVPPTMDEAKMTFSHLPGALQVPLEVEEEAHSQVAKEAPQDASTIQVKRYDKFHSISSVPKVVVSFLDKVSPLQPNFFRS